MSSSEANPLKLMQPVLFEPIIPLFDKSYEIKLGKPVISIILNESICKAAIL